MPPPLCRPILPVPPRLVYDDDGRLAARAATILERMGYGQVARLSGGLKRWMALTYPTEWSLRRPGEPLEGADFDVSLDTIPIGHDVAGARRVDPLQHNSSAWTLVRRHMERGADRFALRPPARERRARFEACAARLAQEDAIRYCDIPTLQGMLDRRDQAPVYLVDVRTKEEYAKGHIPGFLWFPRGQTRPYVDEAVVMQNCPVVWCCERKARATIAASWLGQMGFAEVYAVDGGTAAWEACGLPLECGVSTWPLF